jgi:triosephosphate isomerase
MRTPFVAGNWKMNTTVDEAVDLVDAMVSDLEKVTDVEIVLCPPIVALPTLADEFDIDSAPFGLGAQNMYYEDKGAFTGEVSPLMLVDYCEYVIVGHSERRQFFGETDEIVNLKAKAALKHKLAPIICVGETLAQYESGQTEAVVTGQVRGVLAGISAEQLYDAVIAYEPVWAIGTGKAATGTGANAVIGLIRKTVAELAGQAAADELRILYGGSVTPRNIVEFMSQPEIDGSLVGGASLKAHDFVAILRETARLKSGQGG